MKEIYTVAHTHWDFEWYFTRQEAKVQFIFHMDEVLAALEENQLDFYVLDGQMSILDDYLNVCPEKEAQVKKFISMRRLFVGPWFTQIDEMTTSGESIVRNLRIGIQEAEKLGHAMRIGYLPDSFGQSQDMPKIYAGFNIDYALFWRGLPKEAQTRYFYWSSNDGSKVLTANLKNGYYAGIDLIEQEDFSGLVEKISTDTDSSVHLLPVGGDQRAVDTDLKDRLSLANAQVGGKACFIESNYPQFFKALEKESSHLPTLSGEFIEPSDSKIHRGIYSSRYDLKRTYDQLERLLTYQLEPMTVLAATYGIDIKQEMINNLWKTVARGQAHDSAGGCNSDKTNQDIFMRGIHARQETQSYIDYLLRKLSVSIHQNQENELFMWNPLPFEQTDIRKVTVSTTSQYFKLLDENNQSIAFEIIDQKKENAALLRRNKDEMAQEIYFKTTIIFKCTLPPMGYTMYRLVEAREHAHSFISANEIENEYFKIKFQDGNVHLFSKEKQQWYRNFLQVEDGGDEGDTYDYSPAFDDWLLDLDFSQSDEVVVNQGELLGEIKIKGMWQLPRDLFSRKQQERDGFVAYSLAIELTKESNRMALRLKIDNQVLDHRLRLLIVTDVHATASYADTPFGVIERPIEDIHLHDWQEIGYKEEPTSMRPMLHFATIHSETSSWTFLTKGAKDFQVIGEQANILAITIFRGVGYLGRPDTLRRPGDASGLQTKVVETPDSQLLGQMIFEGSIVLDSMFDAQKVQMAHLSTTQDHLYYQTQSVNRFTTPIQYFPINLLPSINQERTIVTIEDSSVVFSSLLPTIDGTGMELRLYNNANNEQSRPGCLRFSYPAEVSLLDLEGKVKKSLASKVSQLDMTPFKPGEIRTYGIFFNKKGVKVCND